MGIAQLRDPSPTEKTFYTVNLESPDADHRRPGQTMGESSYGQSKRFVVLIWEKVWAGSIAIHPKGPMAPDTVSRQER